MSRAAVHDSLKGARGDKVIQPAYNSLRQSMSRSKSTSRRAQEPHKE